MKVEVDGKTYQLFFQYTDEQLVRGQRKQNGKVRFPGLKHTVKSVTCFIRPAPKTKLDRPKAIATGTALCSPLDNFSKCTGRKLALTRALEESGFSRDSRRAVWTEYLRTHKI